MNEDCKGCYKNPRRIKLEKEKEGDRKWQRRNYAYAIGIRYSMPGLDPVRKEIVLEIEKHS
jgi:hypothetical protein